MCSRSSCSALKLGGFDRLLRFFCGRGPLYRDLLLAMVRSTGGGGDTGEHGGGIVVMVSKSARSRSDEIEDNTSLLFSLVLVATQGALFARYSLG